MSELIFVVAAVVGITSGVVATLAGAIYIYDWYSEINKVK